MTSPPSGLTEFADEAHEYIYRRVLDQVIGVDTAMMLILGLAEVAQTLGEAIPAAEATHGTLFDRIAAEITRATQAEATLSARIAALESRSLRGTTGTGTVSSVLATGTNLTVTLKTPMPDANYVVLPPIVDAVSGINLSNVTAVVTGKTATTVTVRVTNSGLALLQTLNLTVIALSLT